MFVLKKGQIVAVTENKERVVVELDKLLAVYTFDESIFEQLNIPEREEQS